MSDSSAADVLSAHGTLNVAEHGADAPPQMESDPQLFLSADRGIFVRCSPTISYFVMCPLLQQDESSWQVKPLFLRQVLLLAQELAVMDKDD